MVDNSAQVAPDNVPESSVSEVGDDGVTYMTWLHESDTSVEKPIFSKHNKFHVIKDWKRPVFTHCWFQTGKKPVGFMLMCHGIHEHAARFNELMRGIVLRTGIAVVGVDWAGHGRSARNGPDGKMLSHWIVHDAFSLVERVQQGKFPAMKYIGAAEEKPWYIFGHSMGGCIAFNLLLERPGFFRAACFSAPLTDITYGMKATCVLKPIFRFISKHKPMMIVAVSEDIVVGMLTNDKAKQEEWENDKLMVRSKICVRLMMELSCATTRLNKEAHTIKEPMCIIHSTADTLVPIGATEELLKKITCEDVKYVKKSGWLHEMCNEGQEGLNFLINEYSEWILMHAPK